VSRTLERLSAAKGPEPDAEEAGAAERAAAEVAQRETKVRMKRETRIGESAKSGTQTKTGMGSLSLSRSFTKSARPATSRRKTDA